jgi:EpsD family peptidyl-prolyl cis-trans isomerase
MMLANTKMALRLTTHIQGDFMRPFVLRTLCLTPMLWGLTALHAAVPTAGNKGALVQPSPVLATVDGEPITLQRVQVMAWHMSQRQPNGPKVSQEQALEELINLQLQARQARQQGVDALYSVSELLAISQMEVLARGLSDVKRQLQVPPTEEEIKAYYEQNPELFSRRKLYVLQELVMDRSSLSAEDLKRQVAKADSMKALMASLEKSGATVKLNQITQAAENLPLEALPEIAAAPEGKPQWRSNANGAGLIYVVVASRSQPKSLEESAPLIRLFLLNKDWLAQSARFVKELRDKALIERNLQPASSAEPQGSFTFGK